MMNARILPMLSLKHLLELKTIYRENSLDGLKVQCTGGRSSIRCSDYSRVADNCGDFYTRTSLV